MRKTSLFFTLLLISVLANAQSAKDIVGKWLGPDKDAKIEITETGGKFNGKIVWMKKPYEADGKTLRKDEKNKDEKLRQRTILNSVILSNFVFEDGKWTNGKIYDPKSGKTYSCEMKLKDGNLNVRGYVGNPIFGRTAVFTRSN